MNRIDFQDSKTWPPIGCRVRFIVDLRLCHIEEAGYFEPPGGILSDIDGADTEYRPDWGTFHGEQGFYAWDDITGWAHLH